VVSHAGAQGVAQFMPAVAAERGLRNPFDALDALPHSARFLKEHVETFGNLGLAAAAYNGGARRVMDWLARRGKLPQETRDYVKIITGHPPERWTEEDQIDLAVNLPSRAPCEGVADLSREAEPAKVAVQLEPPVAKVIVAARIAAAKAAAAAKARVAAAAKAKRGKLLAKGRGGKDKPPAAKVAEKPAAKSKPPAKIADRAPTDRGRGGTTKLAETSAAKR
jgi:soluble lytic murein transglycosylase-like protein